MANTLGTAGGYCAGEQVVVDHQRINSASFIFVSFVQYFFLKKELCINRFNSLLHFRHYLQYRQMKH